MVTGSYRYVHIYWQWRAQGSFNCSSFAVIVMPRFQLHPQLHWPIWPLKCLKSLAAVTAWLHPKPPLRHTKTHTHTQRTAPHSPNRKQLLFEVVRIPHPQSPYFANTTPKTHCITCATHLGHIDLDPCQMPDNEPSTECLQPELLTGHMDAWTQCV